MSSLLYPVGPLPPRVYWVRRGVVLGAPLVLILIIAVACSGGGGKKSPSAGSGPTTTPSASSSTSSNPDAACVPGDLSAQLGVDAADQVYPIGASPVFTASITNVSLRPCEFTSSPANETWTVISGVDKYWTTAGCPAQGSSSTKTLEPGASHRISIRWDGKRLDPGCKPGAQAAAGTYRLRATLDGVKARQVIFYIHTNTQ